MVTAITFMVVFMAATLVIALFQEDMGWGWWWVLPLAGGFVLLVFLFRVAVQRSQEAADRADREADALEAEQR